MAKKPPCQEYSSHTCLKAPPDGREKLCGTPVRNKTCQPAKALTADILPSNSTPSKDTGLTNDGSQKTRPSDSVLTSPKKRRNINKGTSRIQAPRYGKSEDSLNYFVPSGPYRLLCIESDGKKCVVSIDMDVKLRLEEMYQFEDINLDFFLRNYFVRMYEEAKHTLFPYKASELFYVLSRTACSITHELFADALKFSGVLQEFSSSDICDEAFGSAGKWEDIEGEVFGAAGLPSFSDPYLQKVLDSCEKRVKLKTPFCRIYVIPFEDSGPLAQLSKSECFNGEIVAEMEPRTLSARHQRCFFEADSECANNDYRPNLKTALVVWVNKSYRRLYPVPLDIDEFCSMVNGGSWKLFCIGFRRFGELPKASKSNTEE